MNPNNNTVEMWELLPRDLCYGEPEIWCDDCKGSLKALNAHFLKKALEIIGEDESDATENFAIKRQNHNNALRTELRKAFKDTLGEGEE